MIAARAAVTLLDHAESTPSEEDLIVKPAENIDELIISLQETINTLHEDLKISQRRSPPKPT